MIYVYAIVEEPRPFLEGLTGMGGADVLSISHGPLAAVCSLHADFDADATAATLWQHERVTAALMTRGAVAPVRFGTLLPDEGRVRSMLSAQEPYLAPVLRRLRGKVELAVRATAPAGANVSAEARTNGGADRARLDAPTLGRAYLRSLRHQYREEPDVALPAALSRLHANLAAEAVASSVRAGADGAMVASYLVDGGDVESFRRALVTARAGLPRLRISLTGPWAPFSFVQPGVMADA